MEAADRRVVRWPSFSALRLLGSSRGCLARHALRGALMNAVLQSDALPANGAVSYGLWQEAFDAFPQRVADLIQDLEPRSVCEIGGGAQPSVTTEAARKGGYRYVVLDISREQLERAPAGYEKVVADIS